MYQNFRNSDTLDFLTSEFWKISHIGISDGNSNISEFPMEFGWIGISNRNSSASKCGKSNGFKFPMEIWPFQFWQFSCIQIS